MAITSVCVAQSPPGEAASAATRPVQAAVTQTAPDDQAPLTDRERALLDRIRNLEARLSAVESKVSAAPAPASDVPPAPAVVANTEQQTPQAPGGESQSKDQPSKYESWKQASSPETWGGLDPGNGFQVAKTKICFFVQASQMVWPKRVEVYGATSRVYGDTRFGFGQSHEFLGGTNYYPVDSRNLRINLQVIRVQRSPVSSVFGYYTAGQRGTIVSLATSLLF